MEHFSLMLKEKVYTPSYLIVRTYFSILAPIWLLTLTPPFGISHLRTFWESWLNLKRNILYGGWFSIVSLSSSPLESEIYVPYANPLRYLIFDCIFSTKIWNLLWSSINVNISIFEIVFGYIPSLRKDYNIFLSNILVEVLWLI